MIDLNLSMHVCDDQRGGGWKDAYVSLFVNNFVYVFFMTIRSFITFQVLDYFRFLECGSLIEKQVMEDI